MRYSLCHRNFGHEKKKMMVPTFIQADMIWMVPFQCAYLRLIELEWDLTRPTIFQCAYLLI